jgi:hypothetical protein
MVVLVSAVARRDGNACAAHRTPRFLLCSELHVNPPPRRSCRIDEIYFFFEKDKTYLNILNKK